MCDLRFELDMFDLLKWLHAKRHALHNVQQLSDGVFGVRVELDLLRLRGGVRPERERLRTVRRSDRAVPELHRPDDVHGLQLDWQLGAVQLEVRLQHVLHFEQRAVHELQRFHAELSELPNQLNMFVLPDRLLPV